MWANIITLVCALRAIDAVFMISLPSAEVEKKFADLASNQPFLLKSPNDADQSSTSTDLIDVEKQLHAPRDAKNLVDLAESLNLTVLVKGLEETGLDNIIDHEGKFTLFAPTDEAFKNIPEWARNLPLKEVLRYHVARGLIYSSDIKNDLLARSLLTKRDIRLNVYKNGDVVTANGVQVTSVNYTAHNGVLHIVDRVMVSIYDREGSIVRELRRCPVFKTLSKLINVAELSDALHGKGPFTLFAPSDDAFAKLPADVVKHLVDNPPILRQVLLYHVVPGTWFSAGLEDGKSLDTLQKSQLSVSVQKGSVVVGGKSTVTGPDAVASNGAIHSIDTVLMPPSVEKKLAKIMIKSSKRKQLKGRNGD